MTDKEEYMEKLDEILTHLKSIEVRLDILEATVRYYKPFRDRDPDPNYWQYPRTPNIDPMFGVIKCIKCGMEFRGATGYVCTTQGCPTFSQVTYGDMSVTTGSTSSYVGQGRRDNMSSPGDKNYED